MNSHLAGRVVADDLLIKADADDEQVAGRGERQTRAGGLVGTAEHVQLPLGVGVPQHHGPAIGDTSQQGALHHGQSEVVDGLESRKRMVIKWIIATWSLILCFFN